MSETRINEIDAQTKQQAELAATVLDLQRQALEVSNILKESQIEVSERQEAIAAEREAYYENFYRPLEAQMAREVRTGLDPEQYRDRAIQQVEESDARAREIYKRDLSRYGLNPESGRYQAVMSDFDIQRAASMAGAGTMARMNIAELNRARDQQMAGLGRGIPSEASTMLAGAARGYSGAGQTAQAGFNMGIAPTMDYMKQQNDMYGKESAAYTRFGIQELGFDAAEDVAKAQAIGQFGQTMVGWGFGQGGA